METINTLFLLAGLLLFISVLTSGLSGPLGLPLLLLFLIVGMLAGEDGPGGIVFNDFFTASAIGQLALAIILLDGGLRTKTSSFRVALKPAISLATWGVVATTGLLGLFMTWFFNVDWRLGLLLAAIVGSTDAAAVFGLLRNSGIRLNERVRTTLEIESGANDPMAILLVAVMVDIILHPQNASLGAFLAMLLTQAGIGLALGLFGGWVLSRLLYHLNLAEGLYALLILSGGLLVFAAANLMNGSGFLAVFVAGILVGNRKTHATEHVLRVMDGLAWLSQAGLFVVLGLLVTPSHMLNHAWQAVVMALFLMLVARPIAVATGLWPFGYTRKEVAFVSWVGLRGAVPVVLAIIPVVMGAPNSQLIFDVAFAVVLLSLMVQGATIPAAARLLKVELPPADEPLDQREFWVSEESALLLYKFQVAANSRAEGRHPDAISAEIPGGGLRCIARVHQGVLRELQPETRLATGDHVWYIAGPESVDELSRFFGANAADIARNAEFFGEFSLAPTCPAAKLALAYGLKLNEEERGKTIQQVFMARLGRPAVTGDRVVVGHFALVVREMDKDGHITMLGLKLPGGPKGLS